MMITVSEELKEQFFVLVKKMIAKEAVKEFTFLDRNKDGKLTLEEIALFYQGDRAKKFLDEFDLNKDGKVDKDEIIKVLTADN